MGSETGMGEKESPEQQVFGARNYVMIGMVPVILMG